MQVLSKINKKFKGKPKRYHENHLGLGLQVVSLHL
jgi:hypothetical protein